MKAGQGSAGAGIALAALGGGLAVLAFVQPPGLHAPAWVVYAMALAFVFAGGLVVARVRRHDRLVAWLPVALLACMVVPPLWIGFGEGERRCGVAFADDMLRVFGVRSGLPCRIAFGIAAVLGLAMLVLAIRHAARSGRRGPG